MRTKVFAAILLVVVTVVGLSTVRQTPIREALLPRQSPAEVALDRVLPQVDLDGVPFDEAIKRLEGLAGVQIVVDWEKLQAEGPDSGFDPKAPVLLRARDIRLSETLSRILA